MRLKNKIIGLALSSLLSCAQAVPYQKAQLPAESQVHDKQYFQGDLEQRIQTLPPQIQQEIKDGELKVEFKELKKDERLNATYDSSEKTITIQCTPYFVDCYNSALEHE